MTSKRKKHGVSSHWWIWKEWRNLLDAMLMACSTLSQFASTQATAGLTAGEGMLVSVAGANKGWSEIPSAPPCRVSILCSKVCICSASAWLKSRNCLSCSSSCRFDSTLAAKEYGCCVEPEDGPCCRNGGFGRDILKTPWPKPLQVVDGRSNIVKWMVISQVTEILRVNINGWCSRPDRQSW